MHRFTAPFNRIIWVAAVVIGITQMSWGGVIPAEFNGIGSSSFDGWINLTGANFTGYGGFPGNVTWPAPIGSNQVGSGDADLSRVVGSPSGGGPYLASDSIYFGNIAQIPNALGGTLRVTDTTPLTSLKTVVFQIQIGEAVGYDFHEPAGLPVLKVNGQTIAISASCTSSSGQRTSRECCMLIRSTLARALGVRSMVGILVSSCDSSVVW